MRPDNITELLVARFSYASYLCPNKPRISSTRRMHNQPPTLAVVREWFNTVVATERAKTPPGSIMRFADYCFKSAETGLFKVNGVLYDKILVVIGDELSYWNFYKIKSNEKGFAGEASLTIGICPCCFDKQYKTVMGKIHEWLSKQSNAGNGVLL